MIDPAHLPAGWGGWCLVHHAHLFVRLNRRIVGTTTTTHAVEAEGNASRLIKLRVSLYNIVGRSFYRQACEQGLRGLYAARSHAHRTQSGKILSESAGFIPVLSVTVHHGRRLETYISTSYVLHAIK